MLQETDQPVSTQLIEKASDVHIENPSHLLPVDRDTQRIQRVVLAALGPEPI